MINASIVTYKTKESDLVRVLECMVGDESINNIFVVDNSSTDHLYDSIHELSTKIIYLFGHGNIGYGRAHNISIRKSIEQDVEYHMVVNPDICFTADVIPALVEYMDSAKDVGAVMPKIVYPDGEIQHLCKCLPCPLDLVSRRFIPLKKWADKKNHRYELRDSGYDKILNVPCLSGCFMFLRVEALKTVGLFDENIFMYMEDFDLYRRIHRKYKTIYYPFVSVVHEHAKESYKSKKLLKAHIRSSIYYFNKWGWLFDKERKKYNRRVLNFIYK